MFATVAQAAAAATYEHQKRKKKNQTVPMEEESNLANASSAVEQKSTQLKKKEEPVKTQLPKEPVTPIVMNPEKPADPTFDCKICAAEFTRRFNRDRHMELIHKIPRPDLPPLYPEVLKNATPVLEPPKAESLIPIGSPPMKPSEFSASQPAMKKPKTEEVKEEPRKNYPPEANLAVTNLPINHEVTPRRLMPTMTIHFCGLCDYPNRHRYIMMNNGHAVVMVPVCQTCNKLNIALSKTLRQVQQSATKTEETK